MRKPICVLFIALASNKVVELNVYILYGEWINKAKDIA